ncbi:MAG: 50S ribosomal protein L11 methyltransferase [Elusimicrobia bacterium]|nr:50S ribosomal protein L11 methyltransferase [Elusimicrobiota bacterium]
MMKASVVFQVICETDSPGLLNEGVFRLLLATQGLDPCSLVKAEEKGREAFSVYCPDRKTGQDLEREFRHFLPRGVRVRGRSVRPREWETKWKEGWRPLRVGKRIVVIPLWQKDRRCPSGRVPIYLDTVNAFGTGQHETTRFTIELMEGLSGEAASFLDIGTGSGILMIAASRLGIRKVRGFDVDRSAVSVAKENLRTNGLAVNGVRVADIGRYSSGEPFDLVAANLVTPDLLEHREKILGCVKPGGSLIVSGISRQKAGYFLRMFSGRDLVRQKVLRGKEWIAVLWRRKA